MVKNLEEKIRITQTKHGRHFSIPDLAKQLSEDFGEEINVQDINDYYESLVEEETQDKQLLCMALGINY